MQLDVFSFGLGMVCVTLFPTLLLVFSPAVKGLEHRKAVSTATGKTAPNCALTKPQHKAEKLAVYHGDVEDITEAMLEAHNIFAKAHNAAPFTANATAQMIAVRWCEVQLRANCDLVYPLNQALNAAVAPAFLTPKDIVQFWYNERSRYNVHKSLLTNIVQAQQEGYEILHYANIVADYANRQLGCCRAPCKDGICMVYGCAYVPHGVGYWTVGHNPQGFEKFVFKPADSFKDESLLLSAPSANLVTRVPHEERISIGCTARVPGSGPTSVSPPWVFSCRPLPDVTQLPTLSTREDFTAEQRFFFTAIPLFTADCNTLDLPIVAPSLVYCPMFCTDDAIRHYREAQRIKEPTEETYTVHDAGQSVCGKMSTQHTGFRDGRHILYHNQVATDKTDILQRNTCSAIYETFVECGLSGLQCLASVRFPSKEHPWIVAEQDTAAHSDIGGLLLLLRNSFCSNAVLSIRLLPLPKPLGQLALIASYLNPLNFVAFNIDTTTGVGALLSCTQDGCQKNNQTLVGDVLHRPLHLELRVTANPEISIQASLDGELIGSLTSRGDNIGVLGSFGLAVSKDAELQFMEQVNLVPFSVKSGPDTDRPRYITNSLLPFWIVGGRENLTEQLDIANKA